MPTSASEPTAPKSLPATPRPMSMRMRVFAAVATSFALLLGMCVIGAVLREQHALDHSARQTGQRARTGIQSLLQRRAAVLQTLLEELVSRQDLADAMARGDRDALLGASEGIFRRLLREHNVTHLYFHDPNRHNVLRVHQPARHGDRIDRFTARRAQRDGNVSWGVEIGPLGTFTLRAVKPWRRDGRLLGYVEVGEEVAELLRSEARGIGGDLVLLIGKQFLDRDGWSEGMALLGRPADWDALPKRAIVDQTIAFDPAALAKILPPDRAPEPGEVADLTLAGRRRKATFVPLIDAGDRRVGTMVVLRDVEAALARTGWFLAAVIIAASVLLGAMLLFFHRFLGTVDRELAKRTEKLAQTNEDLQAEVEARLEYESALGEQVRFLQQMIDTIPSPLFYKNTRGIYLGVNRALAEMLGKTPEEMVGRSVFELYPREVAEVYHRADCELFDHPGSQVYESVIPGPDGTMRDVLFTKATYTNTAGQVVGLVGVATEMTQQKLAERAALREYRRLSAMISGMDQGVCLLDADGLVLEINDSFCQMIGIERPDLLGKRIGQLEESPVFSIVAGQIEHYRNDPEAPPLTVGQRLGGTKTILRAQPIRDGRRCDGMVVSLVDVTELVGARERAEQASEEAAQRAEELETARSALLNMVDDLERRETSLQEAYDFQQYILDTAATAILIFDADRRVTGVNAEFCAITGYDREEILGKTCSALRCEGCQSECILKAESETTVSKKECTIHAADGRALRIMKNAVVLRNDAGRATGGIESFVDVTDLVTARENALKARGELEETNSQLEEAIGRANEMAVAAETAAQSKAEFLANMSHEIRTPMTAILGYADLLAEPTCPETERTQHLQVIRRNGEHLLELINDILDFSKIEANRLELSATPTSPAGVIADVASLMRLRASQKGVKLIVRYESALPETILIDEARLRQSLVNLVGNAVKFTDDGEVRIVARFEPHWRTGAPAVEIRVEDTGVGISAEQLDRLFRPFMQADSSTSRKHGGTGLGLAITRHLMELMGGAVDVQSRVGAGSTFSLHIPTGAIEGVKMLDDPSEAVRGRDRDAPTEIPADLLAGRRVLLAEDGPDNQKLIGTVLAKAGAAVEIAPNGRIACELARQQTFDVVLMDMQMPEMDGYQAAAALRAEGLETPILALTAHAMASDRQKCLAAGCDDYLTKPIDRPTFLAAVAQYAAGGRPERTEPDPDDPAELILPDDLDVDLSEPEEGLDDDGPTAEAPPARIVSQFADDEDLSELLAEFVAELPARAEQARAALAHGDAETARRTAHQLKGAGGSYGYPTLTDAARKLEDRIKAEDEEAARLALSELQQVIDAIIAGAPNPADARENQS